MKKILIIDDSINRIEYFIKNLRIQHTNTDISVSWAESYDSVIDKLTINKYDLIFLDHDLGENSKTGADIAEWMKENNKLNTLIVIHTMNPVGRNNIKNVIPDGIVSSGIWLNPELLQECVNLC
jgi:CheY-like chemotaxis protein